MSVVHCNGFVALGAFNCFTFADIDVRTCYFVIALRSFRLANLVAYSRS